MQVKDSPFAYEGFDALMRPLNAPITRNQKIYGFDFSNRFEVQSGAVKGSRLQIKDLVKLSNSGSATVSSLASGSSILININLSPTTTYTNSRAMGMVNLSIYQGTTADSAFQIYPKQGGSINYDDYRFVVGNDWSSSDNNDLRHMVVVANESGTAYPITLFTNVRYVQNNDGVSE